MPQLVHTGRAQCPECGVPLALREHDANVTCTHCGGVSLVQRRLRTIEAVIDPGIQTADAPRDTARHWAPSHVIPATPEDEGHCPTCGGLLEADTVQAVLRCRQCGTQSKMETRLVRSRGDQEDFTRIDAEIGSWELDRAREAEQLVEQAINGVTALERAKAARTLCAAWAYIHAATLPLLPKIFQALPKAEPAVELGLADVIGKFLCHEDHRLHYAVLRQAEKYTFNSNVSRELLLELGLGTGICLKLLLDSADYLAQAGAIDTACTALWGCNRLFERRYEHRDLFAAIILYRLLYLRGPVQAWALLVAKGQGGIGYRYPTKTLIHFIDDCAAERPELIPHIIECFYSSGAKSDGEWVGRLDELDQFHTDVAKAAAISQLLGPPEGGKEKTVEKVLDRLLELAKHPSFTLAAEGAIIAIIDETYEPRPAVEAMVKKHGDSLPIEVRRAYLRYPGSKGKVAAVPDVDWGANKRKPSAFDKQIEEWTCIWDAGIRRAVEDHEQRQQAARDFWNGAAG